MGLCSAFYSVYNYSLLINCLSRFSISVSMSLTMESEWLSKEKQTGEDKT